MTENKLLENNSVKVTFLQMIIGPYGLIADKFIFFAFLGSIFAVLMSVLYLISGQNALCINSAYRAAHHCSDNLNAFITIHLISFFICCIFMRCWYQTALLEKKFTFKNLIPQMADLKIVGCILAFGACFCFSLAAVYLLYVREPSPNWIIEVVFFTIVSSGFVVPLVSLRFFSIFAFAAEDKPLPALKVIWKKSSGNGFAILSGIIILLIFAMFISQAISQSFMSADNTEQLHVLIGSEYLSNVINLFIAACFMNYCYLQKKFLFERN